MIDEMRERAMLALGGTILNMLTHMGLGPHFAIVVWSGNETHVSATHNGCHVDCTARMLRNFADKIEAS